ncbi:DUF1579 family protein [Lysobacter sp. LF1]|uniref:DUF1579 family protein n=1 Tax=Lysobacter stagni TaxID=3045172 RepID=A0ABT6XCR2_9GAMM|nr:DUF1579 family protein [Lysobacter sp. LF1]MDI9237856.1 DUF1579 family protein [Lysobacter sp. LF1]
MKTLAPLALALALAATTLLAHAGEATPRPAVAAGTVGDEHRRLGELAGLWAVRQSLWLTPGQPPRVDAGTAEFSIVLGGRALRQDLRVSSDAPFQGIGHTGFDNVSRTYFTSWMDVNFTDLLVLRGEYDEASHTYRFSGSMTGADGTHVPTREELRVVDANHLLARYFETKHGTETLVVELAYSRR